MKRKTSLIVWGAVLLLAAYGIYDIVREVRRSYTSCYAHTYSHAIGQMMGPRFDSVSAGCATTVSRAVSVSRTTST